MTSPGRKLPAGRHGLSRSFVVSNQRERILAAVADGVAEKGYAALTVEHIVRLAGVSRRTYYDQFSGKRDAFFAAYDASVEQCMLAAATGFASGHEWPEQVRLALRAALRFFADEPAFTRMGMVDMPLVGPDGQTRHFAARASFEVFLAPGAALARWPIRPLVPRTIGNGIFELIYARIVRNRARELPDLLPAMTYHCIAPYLGPNAAAAEAEAARLMATA